MRPAERVVVFDRDGTLVVDRGYLGDPDGLTLLPGVAEALRELAERGYRLIVITNQSGIGRGLFSVESLNAMNERLEALVANCGARLERIYACPHRPEDDCQCRKPRPKLLFDAAIELRFDPKLAIVVGDKPSDVQLGKRVGAISVLVRSHGEGGDGGAGGAVDPGGADGRADYVVQSLPDLLPILEALDRPGVL